MLEFVSCWIDKKESFEIENGVLSKFSLFYIADGEMNFCLDGENYTAGAGDMVCFPPQKYFERRITRFMEFYHLRFENPTNVVMPYGKITVYEKERFISDIKYLMDLENVSNGERKLKNHFLNDIFIWLETGKNILHRQRDEIFIKAINYINENMSRKITLKELAANIGVSVPCLIEHFKNAAGTTPIDYFINLRIRNAKVLLCETLKPISEIAEKCGFENPYYFSNAFKKAEKITPSEFRKRTHKFVQNKSGAKFASCSV